MFMAKWLRKRRPPPSPIPHEVAKVNEQTLRLREAVEMLKQQQQSAIRKQP